MYKFLKILLTLIFILLSICGIFLLKPLLDETTTPVVPYKTPVTYYKDERNGIYLALFAGRELEFNYFPKNPKDIRAVADTNKYEVAINGMFFSGRFDNANPVGLLQINGSVLTDHEWVTQLSHIIVYNNKSRTIEFLTYDKVKNGNYKGTEYTLVQTGPLILNKNQTATKFINAAKNGNGLHFRTVLGKTDKNEIFFLVTTKEYSLNELAVQIKLIEPLQNRVVSAINLDGGSSTSIYTKECKEFCFREGFKRAFVVGVK